MTAGTENKINISRVINLTFLAYHIIWQAFGRLVVQVDAAGRAGMFLLVLVLFFNFSKLSFWRTYKIKPIFIWLIWCVVVSAVGAVYGIHIKTGTLQVIYNSVFTPLIIMSVACYEVKRNPKGTLLYICFFFLIYMLIGILMQQGAKLYNGRVSGGLWNLLPLTSLAFVAMVMLANVRQWLSTKYVIIALLLSIIAIMMVATRKALVALVIMSLFWYLTVNDVRKASSLVWAVLIIVVIYSGLDYMMDNTVIGQRFSIVEEQGQRYNKSSVAVLNFLGDRLTYYIEGWKIYKSHPIFGIGLWNYKHYLSADMPIHSEYMVQLAECGTVGTVLFVAFYVSLFKCIFRIKKNPGMGKTWLTLLGMMIFMLFLNLSAWTYSYKAYFVMFGVIIGMVEGVNSQISGPPNEDESLWQE